MGEVWRARDTKLGREVAIKSLPQEFAQDRERRARLEQEARALATLNHSNVGAIYGLEERDEAVYLVLELIEGATLADEIANGPLPLERALAVGTRIAEGLEAAHDAGIVHRDLKPANIKVGRGGSLEATSVKILDFGLARSLDRVEPRGDSDHTLTAVGRTLPGMIVGTVAYMSPEQARGEAVDRRTDIFAFGCVLYECLTGRQAFGGPTMTDALAATVKSDPDWSLLPANVPSSTRELLRRCLEKNPLRRLQSIGDARVVLQEPFSPQPPSPTPAVATTARPLAWAITGALAAGAIAGVLGGRFLPPSSPRETSAPAVVRAVLPLRPGQAMGLPGPPTVAISPDGRTVVFRATEAGVARLYRRALDGTDAEAIAGSEGGFDPFFSPDGQWIAFFAQQRLKKVAATGGSPVAICEITPISAGGTWTTDGWIVFSRGPNFPLSRVSPAGGPVEDFSHLEPARGEHAHVWPQALPGGRLLVTMVFGRDFQDLNEARAVIVSPGEKPRDIQTGSAFARIVPGHLVFVRGDALLAAPFDAARLEVTGPPTPIGETIAIGAGRHAANFSVSNDGTMVFASAPSGTFPLNEVVRLDRAGHMTPLPVEAGVYSDLRQSPDGKRVALTRTVGIDIRLFVFDIARETLSPLTPEAGRYFLPTWSPDGKRIAYTGFEATEPHLYVRNADGSDRPAPLTEDGGLAEFPNSWSPDGQTLAYTVSYAQADSMTRKRQTSDIWLLSMDRKTPAHPWFETPSNEFAAEFSPDGRFLAYVSDESGRREVYVRPFPGPGGKTQVSSHGGAEPAWSSNGKEILYRDGDVFWSVAFRGSPDATTSAARQLFSGTFDRGAREDHPREYDPTPDGSAMLALQTRRRDPVVAQLGVVTNWTRSLGKAK